MEVINHSVVDGETSSVKTEYSIDDLKAFETVTIVEEGSKLAGHIGFSVHTLAGNFKNCSGVFTASDGMVTEPIQHSELIQGVIIHSTPGAEMLPRGGPLRVWFPKGVAVQKSPCGSGDKPVEMKFLRTLELTQT